MGIQALNVVAPIALQLMGQREPIHHLSACLRHAVPGRLLHGGIEGAGGRPPLRRTLSL